jgi:ERCC4-related helicase
MTLPKLIDNKRVVLSDLIKNNAANHEELSIATGYWDLEGTLEIIDSIKDYKKIRLLIGEEPLSPIQKYQVTMNFDLGKLTFPKDYIEYDLADYSKLKNSDKFREVTKELAKMIGEKRLEVKIFKPDNGNKRLHAKAYIFGNENDPSAFGIIGSSNFTKAGLTNNTELNSLEDQIPMVVYTPSNEKMPHTHLSWFNELWNDENTVDWSGEFRKVLEKSPVGDLTYGPYDVYIKTLMEVFADELNPPKELGEDLKKRLFSFQNRNAGLLINKLEKMDLAILADSVGLGKTITAGAVVKHYIDTMDNANILVIAPAALKQQWIDDLANIISVDQVTGDYRIISQQDYNAIRKLKSDYDSAHRIMRKIDLIVIDEAHNLRTPTGVRYDAILELLQQHPDAKILLLTATPINNSLIDIANQIKLASKGRRTSVNVPYKSPEKNEIEMLDYFEALDRIQKYLRKNEKAGKDTTKILEDFRPTIHAGLRHFLVRSTRQGVEAEGSLKNQNGDIIKFPKSLVNNLEYVYQEPTTKLVNSLIEAEINTTFENIDIRKINLNLFSEITQQTLHPLDILNNYKKDNSFINLKYKINEKALEKYGALELKDKTSNTIENIVQAIYMLGFVPYRPFIYDSMYFNKSINELEKLQDVPFNIKIQLTVHNIMHVTWLKRLESSGAALLKSIQNYQKRINLFEKFLDKNYIVNLADAELLESDYGDGEDLEQAFTDYNKYLKDKESILESGGNADSLKKQGIEKIEADPNRFNITQLKADLNRDKKILRLLEKLLNKVIENDPKIIKLKEKIIELNKENKFGKKVLVFSFFADTIEYLQKTLPKIFKDSKLDFDEESGFLTGSSANFESIVGRFAPNSKKYKLKPDENELNYLFSTDVLSEGQNLQDAGILINYDLHWNPVRMIQRNGRINRLGSSFEKVLISNMKPGKDLELYLKLVTRLEYKINTIKNTVGLDQGVLSDDNLNPIQFIDKYYAEGVLPEEEDKLLAYTDKHIKALRKFMDKTIEDKETFERVKNIPLGKWNYLPKKSEFKNLGLSLISVDGILNNTEKKTKDLFFIEIESTEFYKVTYIDYNKALNYIEASEEDNITFIDKINFDRNKILERSIYESKRQFSNPEGLYQIQPHQIKIVKKMLDHFDEKSDLIGTIRYGIRTTNMQKEFESLIREIAAENKKFKTEAPSATTISKFILFIKKVKKDIIENNDKKIIDKIEGVLFYARNDK